MNATRRKKENGFLCRKATGDGVDVDVDEGRNGFPQNEPFATIMNKEKAVEFVVAQLVERKLLTQRSAVRILSSVNYISYQL